MKNFISKYDLKKSFLQSIAFPTIFLSLDSNPSNIFSHFIFSLVITFCFWIVNAVLIHFKNSKSRTAKINPALYYGRFAASYILATVIYISLALLLQHYR